MCIFFDSCFYVSSLPTPPIHNLLSNFRKNHLTNAGKCSIIKVSVGRHTKHHQLGDVPAVPLRKGIKADNGYTMSSKQKMHDTKGFWLSDSGLKKYLKFKHYPCHAHSVQAIIDDYCGARRSFFSNRKSDSTARLPYGGLIDMYRDKWHLTFNLDYDISKLPNDPTNLLYLFAYAYRPNTTRADCTNRLVHGHAGLKKGKFVKGAMHDGTRHYT